MASDGVLPLPDVEEGIKYWESQPASYDGVLGVPLPLSLNITTDIHTRLQAALATGYPSQTTILYLILINIIILPRQSLPRIDALGTRQFLLYLLPHLSTVPSAIRPLAPPASPRRTRALDIGAGVGRVTSDVLLHLFSDVLLVEPAQPFVAEALRRGRASEASPSASIALDENPMAVPWKGIRDRRTSVTFVRATLQDFDPARPSAGGTARVLGRVGYRAHAGAGADPDPGPDGDLDSGFDLVMCQWCLGALSDPDLVAFFVRCKAALRDPARGLVVVKENLCSDDGGPRAVFDESDSSLTRSDLAWKEAFAEAGLQIVHEQIQLGFPEGLYTVKMYALR
ncbi:AdoMet dependent proline di-methyltransferase-domain-containing protein [Trametes gibbosa]|nr:AdoMet dependent proline di-methyltransferase-domain-containing protein [Trametes gibbosa]